MNEWNKIAHGSPVTQRNMEGMVMIGDDGLARLRGRLRAAHGLRPVQPGQERAFWLHDLASTVEAAFGEVVGFPVDGIAADQEAAWCGKLGGYWARRSAADRYDDEFSDRYWITARGDDGRIAGTVAVGNMPSGMSHAKLYSVYVGHPFRRQGTATRVLSQVYDAAVASGLAGITLDTLWVRQETVRFYLARGMWVAGWKHSITFTRSRLLPRYRIEADGEASLVLSVDDGTGVRLLLRAVNHGTCLGWEETAKYTELIDRDATGVAVYSQATLALACAVRGWPLVRSAQDWDDRYFSSDIGGPEGLAYKIGLFEAEARNAGWRVRTPQIPGIPSAGDS